MSLCTFEQRLDKIATHAWETWTGNGREMDESEREQTGKNARDAANNAYHEDYTESQWLARTLQALGVEDRGNG